MKAATAPPKLRKPWDGLVDAAVQAGWRWRLKDGGIVVVYPENGNPPISIHGTPSDQRAYANTRAVLRRGGLEL